MISFTTTKKFYAKSAKIFRSLESNQFTVIGRLGADAEVKYFDNCSKTNISIAMDEGGEKPSWYKVVLWNLSEKQMQTLARGTQVGVTGEMRMETWTDKTTGEPRSAMKLHVNDKMALQLLGRSRKSSSTTAAPAPKPTPKAAPVAQAAPIADEDCVLRISSSKSPSRRSRERRSRLKRDASPTAIKQAYRNLMKKIHPDSSGLPDWIVKRINKAYEDLSAQWSK